MPWLPNPGPTGPSILYFLPSGLTGIGTVGEVVAYLLDSSLGFPTFDPGVTGAVWNNNERAAISKGATGP